MEKLVGKGVFARNTSDQITKPRSEEQESPQSHNVSSTDASRNERGFNTPRPFRDDEDRQNLYALDRKKEANEGSFLKSTSEQDSSISYQNVPTGTSRATSSSDDSLKQESSRQFSSTKRKG